LGFKSKVSRANPKSPSVKATIPKEIVEKVKIIPGDVLDWDIMVEKGKTMMKVRKME